MSAGAVREERPPAVRAVSWVLFFSGVAALAHQVLWTRRLVDVLGAGPETFARVVGAFFGGLALGAAWAAWSPPARVRALGGVVVAELFIAGWAVAGSWGLAEAVARGIPAWAMGDAGRLVLPMLVVVPAAVAMGWVFPAFCSALEGVVRAREVRRWYAWNTLGGVAGLVAVHFLALPGLGLWGATLAAGSVNLLAVLGTVTRVRGGTLEGTSARRTAIDVEDLSGSSREVDRAWPVPVWLLALGSGFAVIALEVVFQQQFLQVTINSHASAVLLLATVLGGLALSAWWAPAPQRWSVALGLAAVVCWLEPWIFLRLQPGLGIVPYELPPGAYHARVLFLSAATALPVFWAVGWVFPSLLSRRPRGVTPGAMLAWNGLGGWLGSEVAHGVLLPRCGLWGGLVVVGALYAAAAAWFARAWVGAERRRVPKVWAATATLVAGAGLAWMGSRSLPQVGASPKERLVEVEVGREGVVAVVTGGTNDWRMLMNNTYTLAGSRAQVSQERQGLLPVLLHGHAESVGLLGFATGSTTAGAALDPAIRSVEAFELSPLVARLARRHFSPWNRRVLEDPRVRLETADARLGVSQAGQRYDVVVGDLFLPWRTGEGRLFSREHFAQVRRALRPGGLFCQWLPMFQLTHDQFAVVSRTFRETFPSAFVVRGDFYAELPILGLCGFADDRGLAGLDWTAVDAACARIRAAAGGSGDGLVRHADGVAMCVLGPLPDPGAGPVNTLANAWLEWNAGRVIIGLREPWMVGVPWAEWVREVHRLGIRAVPEPRRRAHDTGQFYLTLEVAAVSGSSLARALEAQIPERLPDALKRDPGVDWERWPARIKPRPAAFAE